MLKNKKLLIIPICLVILLAGYTTYATIFENKKEPLPLKEEAQIMEEAIQQARDLTIKTGAVDLEKWIIRTIAEAKVFNAQLSDNEVIKAAERKKKENEQFIQYAIEHYNITFTAQEVDEFIAEHFDPFDAKLDNKKIFADLLGITTYEVNHVFDRDLNTQLMVWMMLKPIVAEKHSISMNSLDYEQPVNIDNLLLEAYTNEMANFN